ncbi:hypothetical protein [Modestobacter sp. URMC 112]
MSEAARGEHRPPGPAVLAGAAAALTVLACLAGALGWPLPRGEGWQPTGVAPDLLALVTGTALVCAAAAAALVRPAGLGGLPTVLSWWAVLLGSAVAGAWYDLTLAALARDADGAFIPVLDWLLPAAPAVLAARLVRRRGRATQLRAVLGTAVLSVPVLGLGWAVARAGEGFGAALGGGLWSAVLLGAVPVAAVLVFVGTRPPGRRT